MRLRKQKPPTWTQKEPLTHCPTHLVKLLDDGTCPSDLVALPKGYPQSPRHESSIDKQRDYLDAIAYYQQQNRNILGATKETAVSEETFNLGDVWYDAGLRDTVTIVDLAYISGKVSHVNGMFGDGSGPTWYSVGDFRTDCRRVSSNTDKHNDTVSLNPDDPFERVIIDMVETNRRKRADYAVDGSPWSNFDDVANSLGITGFAPVDSANFNIEQKSARLRSLRKNGRMDDPANESVADTYLDRAVYSVIALAMHKYPEGRVA